MSTLRSDASDAARRAFLGFSRATMVQADDTKKLQEVTVRVRLGEVFTNVEHWLPYGFSMVPLPPTDQQQQQAEALVAYLGGSPDHPVVIATADRRHRPKNLKAGESSHHDDQGQHTHLTRNGVNTTGKKVTITGGDDGAGKAVKPETKNFELNEQLKGLRADLSQIKDSHHALFDVVTKLRQNVEKVVPTLVPVNLATQVTAALSGTPAGLDVMKQLATGNLQAYFQNALKDALKGFLDPSRLLSASSVLSGGIEAAIKGAEAQIANLVLNNPIIGQVDALVEELAGVQASGGPLEAVASKAADLATQIAGLTQANPIIGQVNQLRSTLQGLVDQAGPGMNFLEPQKRLAQGLTKAMRFGGPG